MTGLAVAKPWNISAEAQLSAGTIMAVGGAFLTLSAFSSFLFNMVNGRG